MEDLKKEIENLKRKAFYLSVSLLVMSMVYFGSVVLQLQRYATIQDYYFESLEADQELNQMLKDQTQLLEGLLSKTQSGQPQKN